MGDGPFGTDGPPLDRYAEALRPHLIAMGREHLKSVLRPLWATAERRAEIDAKVDAMTDEQIEDIWANVAAEDAKRCPECGRPYEEATENNGGELVQLRRANQMLIETAWNYWWIYHEDHCNKPWPHPGHKCVGPYAPPEILGDRPPDEHGHPAR